jgi:glycerol-3-phosphate dehydrogenase
MAEDAIDRAAALGGLPRVRSQTVQMKLHGWMETPDQQTEWERVYGTDLPALQAIAQEDPSLGERLHPQLPFRRSEVIWAARHEMAICIEDVLARRTRSLFLDAAASLEAAPMTARLLARELGRGSDWEQEQLVKYRAIAEGYVWPKNVDTL